MIQPFFWPLLPDISCSCLEFLRSRIYSMDSHVYLAKGARCKTDFFSLNCFWLNWAKMLIYVIFFFRDPEAVLFLKIKMCFFRWRLCMEFRPLWRMKHSLTHWRTHKIRITWGVLGKCWWGWEDSEQNGHGDRPQASVHGRPKPHTYTHGAKCYDEVRLWREGLWGSDIMKRKPGDEASLVERQGRAT